MHLASLSFSAIRITYPAVNKCAVQACFSKKLAAQCHDHLGRSPTNLRDANIWRRKAVRNFRHCLCRPSRKPVDPNRSVGRRRRRSRERRMCTNVHGQEHHGNVIGRARAADISTAHRAGQRSMALEPARHVERSGSQLRILDLRQLARRTDQRFVWLSIATPRKHDRSGKR